MSRPVPIVPEVTGAPEMAMAAAGAPGRAGRLRGPGGRLRGSGLDIGVGLVVSDPSTGPSADVRVRMLLAKPPGSGNEGVSVSLSYSDARSTQPSPHGLAAGRGLADAPSAPPADLYRRPVEDRWIRAVHSDRHAAIPSRGLVPPNGSTLLDLILFPPQNRSRSRPGPSAGRRCSQCRQRVQGRHRLQTSDALGAAAVQSSVPASPRSPLIAGLERHLHRLQGDARLALRAVREAVLERHREGRTA